MLLDKHQHQTLASFCKGLDRMMTSFAKALIRHFVTIAISQHEMLSLKSKRSISDESHCFYLKLATAVDFLF